MTCQDRVELMQRYLDHDLSDSEAQELMDHLRQCDECAGLFERLQRLDSELSQLPKVTPRHSLVNAILPRLAELDRLPGALEQTAAKEPAAAASVGGIPWTRRFFASWKLTGGVAVAAAMIGIIIMKGQNLLPPSVAMKGAATGSAESSKAADARRVSGSAANAASAGGGAAKKDSDPTSNASAPAADIKASDQAKSLAQAPAAAPHTLMSSPAGKAREPDGKAAADDSRMAISSSPAEAPSDTEAAQNSAAARSAEAAGAAASPSQPAAPRNEAGPPAAASASQPAADAKATASAQPAPEYKGFAAGPPEDGQYTTQTVAPRPPAPATLKSPDGKLVAAVEELKVVVRQSDTSATVAASTYSWARTDVISLVGFSGDGKLTYRVQHQTGADEVILLDTATKRETKTSAAKN